VTCSYNIRPDYKSLATTDGSPGRLRRIGWFLFGAVFSTSALLYALQPGEGSATTETGQPFPLASSEAATSVSTRIRTQQPTPVALADPAPEPLPAPREPEARPPAVEKADVETEKWHEESVARGDSLARIFERAGLSARTLHALLAQADGKQRAALRRIYPGQRLRFLLADDGGLKALEFIEDRLHTLRVDCTPSGTCRFERQVKQPDAVPRHATATIRSSLFKAARKAGLSDALTMELAGIFGWDIDFALDIREGDRFTVLYEELYLDGEKIGNGEILAAEFINRGRAYRAVRYTDPSGRTDYYDPEGRSMRKAFLRTPVAFTRISSRFSLGRRHPILNRIRAHKGVDYAAPYGTPVKATGDGKVVFAGRKGGYGKVVILRHGSRYSTLYAHLSRYARGIRSGRRVRQGQVIGYVGQSGLATGPHLHYEFRINGVHRNPLTVRLPEAAPLDRRYLADFREKSRELLAQIDRVREDTTRIAMNR